MTIAHIAENIKDPRKTKNQKYTLFELIIFVISSIVSLYNRPDEMAFFAKEKQNWLQQFSDYQYGTSSLTEGVTKLSGTFCAP